MSAVIGVWGLDGDCGNPINRLTVTASQARFGSGPSASVVVSPGGTATLSRPDGSSATLAYDGERSTLSMRPDDGGATRVYRRCRLAFTR